MQSDTQRPMDMPQSFCPNPTCCARGQRGQGNIAIHDRTRQRYRCKICKRTFSAKQGTMFEGLRKPVELILIVVTLLSYGCPIQAIVHAFGLDERTVADWRDRAGRHCQRVHQSLVESGQLDLVHVQADELRVKGRKMIVWMGLALMVSTRLWLAGTISLTRDKRLADRLMHQVRACSLPLRALLVVTDGRSAYPGSMMRAFREKIKQTARRGRACLQVWPDLCIATVIKHTQKKRVVEVTRRMTRGTLEQATTLLQASRGGLVLNTAFIERLNGTMRERLAALTRKCRYAASHLAGVEAGMYLLGVTYNFCWPHQELSKSTHLGCLTTPAMAAGLTDHVWSMGELLRYRIAPAPWHAPKRRGRPKKQAEQIPSVLKRKKAPSRLRPLLRLRLRKLCSTN
jgi:transposase-like protein